MVWCIFKGKSKIVPCIQHKISKIDSKTQMEKGVIDIAEATQTKAIFCWQGTYQTIMICISYIALWE